MREVLFRGKRADNNEWIYGYYCETENTVLRKYMIVPDYASMCYGIDIIPETIGQYTGLTDKNGTKIFEGDVLRIWQKSDCFGTYYNPPREDSRKAEVKWDFCAWMWQIIGVERCYIQFPDAWCHYECEVVGNIHDNKLEDFEIGENRQEGIYGNTQYRI